MNMSHIVKGLLVVLVLCVVQPAVSQTDAAKTLNVGKKFNCKACHVNRLTEIKKNVQPTLIPPESVTTPLLADTSARKSR